MSLRYAVYGLDCAGNTWQHCAPFPDVSEAEEAAITFGRTQWVRRARVFFVVDLETGEQA